MKVIWVANSSGLEGSERSLFETAIRLPSRGASMHVVLPSEGDLGSKLISYGVSTSIVWQPRWITEARFGSKGPRRISGYIKATLRFVKLYLKHRPDVVVTNTLTIPCSALAAKLLNIPHVWYIHEFLEEDHSQTFEFGRRFSMTLVNCISRRVIVNSYAVEQRFSKEISPSRRCLMYYGVDTGNTRATSHVDHCGSPIFVLMGRKCLAKGQIVAIRAFAILAQKHPNARLLLIGAASPPEFEGELIRLASELGVRDRIEFMPFSHDPANQMCSATAVLMCSHCEAFGRVTIEAMKLGRPVIGAASGGTVELIQHGKTGLLFPAGDFESLARHMNHFCLDPKLANELGNNARKWANEIFDPERFADNFLEVLKQAIA